MKECKMVRMHIHCNGEVQARERDACIYNVQSLMHIRTFFEDQIDESITHSHDSHYNCICMCISKNIKCYIYSLHYKLTNGSKP